MSKAIKFKNNMYLDTRGAVHNGTILKTYLDNRKTFDDNLQARVGRIGSFYSTIKNNVNVNANSTNRVISLTLDPGTYILLGNFKYEGSDLRYYITLWDVSLSAWDNAGYVEGTLCALANITERRTVEFIIWPSKTFTATHVKMNAIKIGTA